MSSTMLYFTLIFTYYVIINLNSAKKHPKIDGIRYKGWGWKPNFPMHPELPSKYDKNDTRMIKSNCAVTLQNATFNLLPLHLSSAHKGQLEYYSVYDERSPQNTNDDYKYAFNVCGATLSVPEGCDSSIATGTFCEDNNFLEDGSCATMKSVGNEPVFAYQMKMNEDGKTVDRCWHLSDTVGGPGVWSLINEDNPSEGVVLSYLDGDYEKECEHNRQFDIHFVCDNDNGAFGIPGEARSEIAYVADIDLDNNNVGSVSEEELCQYKLEFHTVYGCPSQCPIVGTKLCNGVGLCGYDWTLKAPRCYCYSLFSGDSCTQIDLTNIFSPQKDPVTADSNSPFVHEFEHKLSGPSKKFSSVTVTYDLEEFHTDPLLPYIMNDIDGITHTYVWNFMDTVNMNVIVNNQTKMTLHDYGCPQHSGYCTDINEEDGTCNHLLAEPGYVYQINERTNTCIVAGGQFVEWSLYDEDNPARGVKLTYTNGDFCETKKANRKFEISLLCPDDSNSYIPLKDESQRIFDAFVEEDDFDFCNYHVSITSALACPDECLSPDLRTEREDDVSVCSAQGMCASDPFAKHVHCLCDSGWTGDYCEEKYVAPPLPFKYKNKGSYIAAIVIISVVLVIVCYFGYQKITHQSDKVKELEIKLVNYQSSGGGGGGMSFGMPRPIGHEMDEKVLSKGMSFGDKIKGKFSGRNKRGKYANISNVNDEDDDEEEQLFNVQVQMNGNGNRGRESVDDDDEVDSEEDKPMPKHVIGDEEDSNED